MTNPTTFFLKIVKVFAQLVWLCAEFKTQKRKKTKGIKYKKASVSQKSVGVLHIFCLNIQCDQQTHSQTSSPSTTTPLCPMGPTQNSGEGSPEPKSRKSQLCSSPFRHVWDCEYMFLCLLSASVCVYVCVCLRCSLGQFICPVGLSIPTALLEKFPALLNEGARGSETLAYRA